MVLEEPVEILHSVITEGRRNHTDLGGWKDTQHPTGEAQADLDLVLRHGQLVLACKRALECTHLDPEFFRYGRHPQLDVAVRSKDEVMHNSGGALQKNRR